MPEADEWPVTCPRCGLEWDWLRLQVTRCPKCAKPVDVNAIKEHFRDTSHDIVIRPEDVKAFDADMKSGTEALIKHRLRRS